MNKTHAAVIAFLRHWVRPKGLRRNNAIAPSQRNVPQCVIIIKFVQSNRVSSHHLNKTLCREFSPHFLINYTRTSLRLVCLGLAARWGYKLKKMLVHVRVMMIIVLFLFSINYSFF